MAIDEMRAGGTRKDGATIAEQMRSRKSNKTVILVEGQADKDFYKRFIPKDYQKQILIVGVSRYLWGDITKENKRSDCELLREYWESDNYFCLMGGYGAVEGKTAVIITIKKQWAEKQIVPGRERINFYGIVDKDYDENFSYIKGCGQKSVWDYTDYSIINTVDIIKEKRLICTDSNDVETMPFMFDLKTVRNICKNKYSLNYPDLNFIMNSACKIGYLRKEDYDKNLNLSFSNLFKYNGHNEPCKYAKYLTGSRFLIFKIASYFKRKNNVIFDLKNMPSNFRKSKWLFCRGHDLMGILASYCVKKYGIKLNPQTWSIKGRVGSFSKVVSVIEESVAHDIINGTKTENYSDSRVIKFLADIVTQSQIGFDNSN